VYHEFVSYIDREGARSSKFAICSRNEIWVEPYLVADLCPFLVQSCNESPVVQEIELCCLATLIRTMRRWSQTYEVLGGLAR